MKIGYQGMIGSYSEVAAKLIIEKQGWQGASYVPLISSQKVIAALREGNIDYGVVAIKNSIGGIVSETMTAICKEPLEQIDRCELPIHHCLFKKKDEVASDTLEKVASHIQALKQTEKTREKRWPHLSAMAIEDTAIGAKWLAEGVLPESVAVICSKSAGLTYGLSLMAEQIEDDPSNHTTFCLFQEAKGGRIQSLKAIWKEVTLYELKNKPVYHCEKPLGYEQNKKGEEKLLTAVCEVHVKDRNTGKIEVFAPKLKQSCMHPEQIQIEPLSLCQSVMNQVVIEVAHEEETIDLTEKEIIVQPWQAEIKKTSCKACTNCGRCSW